MTESLSATAEAPPPFDTARLDKLLDEAGMDAVLISSKHNIQYLFGATGSSSSIISTRLA